jgi:hypothetical protein
VVFELRKLLPQRTVYDGGVSGQTSTQIAARHTADTAHRGDITVLWFGRNNVTDPSQILADVAASVAHLTTSRFLVLSVINGDYPDEILGAPGHDQIVQLNADLAAAYPSNFLDVRAFLVSRYDPANPQDVMNHAQDVPPSSVRTDAVHLSARGSLLVAQQVRDFLQARAW